MRAGFAMSRILGFIALLLFFLLILTPLGWLLRMAGKDPLQLKRQPNVTTFWQNAREPNPLDRLY